LDRVTRLEAVHSEKKLSDADSEKKLSDADADMYTPRAQSSRQQQGLLQGTQNGQSAGHMCRHSCALAAACMENIEAMQADVQELQPRVSSLEHKWTLHSCGAAAVVEAAAALTVAESEPPATDAEQPALQLPLEEHEGDKNPAVIFVPSSHGAHPQHAPPGASTHLAAATHQGLMRRVSSASSTVLRQAVVMPPHQPWQHSVNDSVDEEAAVGSVGPCVSDAGCISSQQLQQQQQHQHSQQPQQPLPHQQNHAQFVGSPTATLRSPTRRLRSVEPHRYMSSTGTFGSTPSLGPIAQAAPTAQVVGGAGPYHARQPPQMSPMTHTRLPSPSSRHPPPLPGETPVQNLRPSRSTRRVSY